MIYVVSRRSYRNGGYNGTLEPVVGEGSQGGNSFLTETVTDGEFGVKFQGSIVGVPTRLNTDIYSMWISNGQHVAYTLNGQNAPAAISINVPRSRVNGFEIDGQINPISWLNTGLAFNYTDAEFTSNLVSILGRPPIVFGTYPDTPKWSGTLYADVTVPVSPDLTATLHGDVYEQKSIAFASTANINTSAFLPGFAVADFRVSIDSKHGWSVAAIVKNAFNRVYYAGGIATAELLQDNTAIPGDPRTYYAEVRYKF